VGLSRSGHKLQEESFASSPAFFAHEETLSVWVPRDPNLLRSRMQTETRLVGSTKILPCVFVSVFYVMSNVLVPFFCSLKQQTTHNSTSAKLRFPLTPSTGRNEVFSMK
jgi:hypothetical protein